MKRYATMCMCLLAAITNSALAQADGDGDTVDLRPMWKQGQTARYDAITSRHTVTNVSTGGQSRTAETRMDITASMSWRVTKANAEGGGSGEMTMDEIALEVTAADGSKAKMDGRGSGDERLADVGKLLKAMRGTPIKVDVAPNGHITSVSGWQTIQNRAGEAGDSLEKRDFIEMATDFAWVVGAGAGLKPGTKWNEQFNWSHEAGDLEMDSRYQFEGIEDIADLPVAMVTRSSKLKLDPKKIEGGPPVSIRMTKGSEASQIMYDLSRHEVVGQNVDRTLNFQVDITLGNRQLTTRVTEKMNSQLLRVSEE